ncbi:hypothetical protein Tco_1155721 [Tanacetum coccineum]
MFIFEFVVVKVGEVDIDALTMEQYLALTRGNQAWGMVKPSIRNNVNFEIKSQFMRKLREGTFLGNKNDEAHEHVEMVLDIVSLFNIPGVTHDAVMLCVFLITLIGATRRWFDMIPSGTINTWDLLGKAFIQRHCSLSKTAKQLEENHNFKQEGDDTLYQAWERYNDLLYKCHTHDLNEQKGPIPSMKPARTLESIQTLADHTQKWHDESRRTSSGSSDGIAAITSKLYSLGRDIMKLKENVHAIQVGCGICEGTHLDMDCPLNEEVKRVEELKYGEFGRSFPNNGGNGATYRKLQENTNMNIRNQNAALKNLETQVEQLTKDFQAKAGKEAPSSSASIVSMEENHTPSRVLPCQLPLKELSPRSFTLPYIIGSMNMYALANLGASVNIMPYSMFKCLKLTSLKETNMFVEMADMSKKAPMGIVENILVKIDKFVFPSDFVVINMLGDPNETMILDENVHHPTIPVKKVYMANSIQEDELFNPLEIGDDMNKLQDERAALRLHSFKPIRVMGNDTCKFYPTCDPNLKECNGGDSIYGMDEHGVLKKWCENSKIDDTTWERRSSGKSNLEHQIIFPNFSHENHNKPRPQDFSFKEWLKVKIGHTNVDKTMKNVVLNECIVDSFELESNSSGLSNEPYLRDLKEYKLVFDNEITRLANEYELRIGKKGYILDDI